MGTRALIVGKIDDKIHFGQSHYDGYHNTEWLQRNMSEPDDVKKFFNYMTEGKGHGISSLTYEWKPNEWLVHDMDKPKVEWYEDSYFCGTTDVWNYTYSDLKGKSFDWPDYISYWDGTVWQDFSVSKDYDKFLEVIKV